MIDLILILILAAIVGAVVFYLCRAKKSGVACIGCPHAKQCGGNCSCGSQRDDKKDS